MKELLFRFKRLPFPYLYSEEEENIKLIGLWALFVVSVLIQSAFIVSVMIQIHKILS